MLTIAEVPEYIRRASELLTEQERRGIVDYLAAHPREGIVMEGTGGVRKGWRNDMSAFKSIKHGLTEAVAHAKGKPGGVKEYRPYEVDVAALRKRLDLTQEQFAARFGFSVATLRHWERGDRKPQGAALVLLNLIDREPKAVMRALAA